MSVQRMTDPYRNSRRPEWSPTDDDTATLLTVLADDGAPTLSAAEEWRTFKAALRSVAWYRDGIIDPNTLRPMLRGQVKPCRIGAFTRRALLEGLVQYTGEWVVSDDTSGKNAGKPCRELRWLG